jgi:hypothetical protein
VNFQVADRRRLSDIEEKYIEEGYKLQIRTDVLCSILI